MGAVRPFSSPSSLSACSSCATTGVSGGVMLSSNASDRTLGPSACARRRAASDGARVNPGGGTGRAGATCGEAPRSPMMDGSRWCSCGIALKRCVMRRAPRWTAAVAMSVDAMLAVPVRQHCKLSPALDWEVLDADLCPIEKTTPLFAAVSAALSTPSISGAAVMIRTPTACSSMSQSSWCARFRAPYTSSNAANCAAADTRKCGACAPRFASWMKGPSACQPRSVALEGRESGRRRLRIEG